LNFLDSALVCLGSCFFIEQIFCWISGSYPYRYGFLIRTIPLPEFDINDFVSMKGKIKKLDVKVNLNKNEVYLRYKYPSLMIGPYLFIGQIKVNNSKSILHIRVGPFSAMFTLFLIMYSFFLPDFKEDQIFQIMNILLLFVTIAFFYLRLWNPIKRITGRVRSGLSC